MKKIVFASAAIASVLGAFDASAAVTCAGAATAGAGSAVAVGGFVKTAFTPKCSANVLAESIDSTSYFAVGAVSSKGKTKFAGSTAGGGVVSGGACASAGACSAAEASAAAAAAPSS